nr:MAG TPA: hypothetical protein [Caudoviricetes sp.]DAP95303.1 MAG TPA: hypothetical protein [Caudoviricetes sp.]
MEVFIGIMLLLAIIAVIFIQRIISVNRELSDKKAKEMMERLRKDCSEHHSICVTIDGCKIMLREDFIKKEWNKTGEGGIPIRGQYESATHFLKRVDEYRKMKAEQKRRYDELTRKQQSILDKNKRTPLPKSEYEADEIKKNYNGEK